MATGGEVQGQCPKGEGSDDLDQLKCQPCLEDGHLRDAVGMCVDCQDYLCLKCYNGHTLPKPSRHHQLLDKDQLLQGQTRIRQKDVCTEKCSIHEDEIVKYYCITHCLLGCTVCVTLDHKTCQDVHYIPHVAKDLTSNEEYRQAESQLKAALAAFKKVSENAEQNAAEFRGACDQALNEIKTYRKKVDMAFDKIEAKLVEQANAIKSKEIKDLAALHDKNKNTQEDLQSALAKIEARQNATQNCSSYIEMMRTKIKLNSLDSQIQDAEVAKSYKKSQIKFIPNLEFLETLTTPAALGTFSRSSKETSVSAKHDRNINVKTDDDQATCIITGIVILPDGRLVLADYNNSSLKIVNVQNDQVSSQLKSPRPWDLTNITKDRLAVTLPENKTVAFVTVGDKSLSFDRNMTVSGSCYGVDYRNNKLAVSFRNPHKVQVLNLKGTVLYEITADNQGKPLFNYPSYLTYGLDDTTLYVSNCDGNTVVCVKTNGTVVATYTDSDLKYPRKPVMDGSGNVYVCAEGSQTVHQISKDCKKIRVLLTQADGVYKPRSICLSEEKNALVVGMLGNDNIKVYKTECKTQ